LVRKDRNQAGGGTLLLPYRGGNLAEILIQTLTNHHYQYVQQYASFGSL